MRRAPQKTQPASPQRKIKIVPLGIHGFDQVDLPLPVPSLQRLLALDRTADVPVFLISDETGASVFPGKARRQPLAMLIDAALQIGCYADIERAIFLVGDDVNISRHSGRVRGCGSQGQALG